MQTTSSYSFLFTTKPFCSSSLPTSLTGNGLTASCLSLASCLEGSVGLDGSRNALDGSEAVMIRGKGEGEGRRGRGKGNPSFQPLNYLIITASVELLAFQSWFCRSRWFYWSRKFCRSRRFCRSRFG